MKCFFCREECVVVAENHWECRTCDFQYQQMTYLMKISPETIERYKQLTEARGRFKEMIREALEEMTRENAQAMREMINGKESDA
jgi:predicted DNA-binding protein